MPLQNSYNNISLIKLIKKLISTKINILDIGAAGGIIDEFLYLNKISQFYGFEPRKDEAEKLNDSTPDNQKYFSHALSDKEQVKIFYNSHSASTSGFYPDDNFFNSRFVDKTNNQIIDETKVECITLNSIMSKFNNRIDIIKLDTEGSELEILKGATECLENTLMILTECHFSKFQKKNNQHFSKIDEFIQNHNFFLYDIDQKRIAKSSLPVGKIFSLFNFCFAGKKNQDFGQSRIADVLYFRDPIFEFKINKSKAEVSWTNDKILKLICILDLYNYQDSAIEILIFFKNRFKENNFNELMKLLIKFDNSYFTLGNNKYTKNYLRNNYIKSLIVKFFSFTQKNINYKMYVDQSHKIAKKLGFFNTNID